MNLQHVAMAWGSEANADRLFVELLGLRKSEPKMLAADLAKAIFGVDAEIPVINYQDERSRFEVFIDARRLAPAGRLDHVCLETEDLPRFLGEARRLGMGIVQAPRGGGVVTFLRDPEGHLFEIKGK